MARKYSNTFAETTLTGSITNSTTTITIASTTGLPASFPYTLAIDYGTATVEMVTVTALAGSNLTVTRGQDGTSAQAHNAGARVVHPVTARDLSEPQVHIDATTDIHGLSGGASVVGTSQAQTLTNKTISGANNTITNIPNTALVAIDAAKVTQPFARMTVTGADGTNEAMTVTGSEVTRTKPVATFKRNTIGLIVDEDGVVDVNSDLQVGTQRSSGAAALTARLFVLATSKIGVLIKRVVSQTQALLRIEDESGNNLFQVTFNGTLNTANAATIGGTLSSTGALSVPSATISGAATVGTTLGVTGLTTASGGLSVTGNATATGTVQGATVTSTGAVNAASAAITGAVTTGAAGVSVASEVWNTATLGNGWTGTLKYRKVASPPNCVQVIGNLLAGTKTDGTVLTTMPAGYRPATQHDMYATGFGGTVSTTQNPHVTILTTGDLAVYGLGSGTNINVNHLFSLDF